MVRVSRIDMALSIHSVAVVKHGSRTWKPAVFKVEGEQCIKLNTYDFNLVSIIASMAGIDIKGAAKMKPSVAIQQGLKDLESSRNRAQAEHLDPRSDDAQPLAKKARRTRCDLAEKRDSPSTCEVLLVNGVAACFFAPSSGLRPDRHQTHGVERDERAGVHRRGWCEHVTDADRLRGQKRKEQKY